MGISAICAGISHQTKASTLATKPEFTDEDRLFASSFAAAFVPLRCYRQLTVGSSRGHGLLRSLAEGECTEGATPCLGAGLASKETPGGVSDDTEVALQRPVESVAGRLIQVTEVCASVAPRPPLPFPMRIAEHLLGFCIQEVAALSTLVGRQFDLQKVELLETAVEVANGIKQSCQQHSTTAQQPHLPRLVKYAKEAQKAGLGYSGFGKEERLQMLQELLELQEAALGLIQTSISPLGPQHEETPLTEEAAHEFTEELRRIIYTRRNQVFSSKRVPR